ncbi:hypothetical protein AB6A40_001671 [Gnathostoma spinigerum]|uniref:ABC-type xenobiotic transporter n=1 Tax=Gnathostoma spinigerum TaxID=75299 RepID=A0ABD6EEL6_9BILA
MTSVFLRAQNSFAIVGFLPSGKFSGLQPITREEFNSAIAEYCVYYLLLGVVMFVTSYIQIACWEGFAERMTYIVRQHYLKAVLRQQIAWFDNQQSGNLTARLSDDLERMREGIGDKMSLLIQLTAAFVAGFGIGFVYSWQMTLVMMAFTPLTAATGAWMSRVTASRTQIEQEKYAVAGAIAEETFSSIRTVLSLNGTKREIERYEKALEESRKTGRLKYLYMAIGLGLSFISIFSSYALAFWYGSIIIQNDPTFDRGSIFTVFFSVMTGSTALGGAVPHLASVAMARGAAKMVLSVINSVPLIDPYSTEGSFPSVVRGALCFKNVSFSYPVRKDIQVLNNVSFNIAPGKKIALVGPSGCGKSTILSLLLRFYDSDTGFITLDGYDLRSLNVSKLRDAVGIVSQEPVLFDGTLEYNIRLGKENATRHEIVEACQEANAWDFIQMLPNGLSTLVGERGIQLSGGQKQRIAIARALIKNPKILILDEATSALDTESELVVQKALEKAQKGRTTIIVAHRLSTIRDVDKIIVLMNGGVTEVGTHESLLNDRGMYYRMVMAQDISSSSASDANNENSELNEMSSSVVSGGRPDHSGMAISTSSVKRRKKYRSISTSAISVKSDLLKIKNLQDAVEEISSRPTPMSKIFLINKESWPALVLGLIGCCISGLVTPFFALVYSEIFNVYSEPPDEIGRDTIFWSVMFVVCGLVSAAGFFISANALGYCGENLTKKIRLRAFINIMRQDVAFFDDPRHGTGKLCTRFATDAPNLRYVFTRLPVVVSSTVTLIGAIVIGFYFGWQLTLILLTIIPLIIGSGYFQMKMMYGKKLADTKLLAEAGKIATQAVEHIRTVQSLNKQRTFLDDYKFHLDVPYKTNVRQVHVYGGVFAFSQSLMFFMYAISFWLGGLFVNDGIMLPVNVYRVFFAIAFCGQSVGQMSAFIPDVVKARLAASLLFYLIEYPTMIDSLSESGSKMKLKGNIQLKKVHFAYPSRPTVPVLRGLTLNIKEGQTVALVGYSGNGKSTVLSLLERFYEPQHGSLFIDGVDIKLLNIRSLRDQVSIVSQEPTLFDCSISENIRYGVDREVPHSEMVNAARLANIHNFILSLPMGYDTPVGEKGTQLSGGQKQRIAIARALLRDPPILLLDEATSALDTESEKVVQEALENARRGRTCLVIAHRLSTIQNSDVIAVVNEGRIVEEGSHHELKARNGIYKTLCETQTLVEEADRD